MEGAGSGFQQRRVYGKSCKGRRPQAGGTAGSDAPKDRQVGSGERILKKKLPEDEFERAGFVVAEGFVGSNGFKLSISEQCRLLGIGRSVYYRWRAQACRRSEKQNTAQQQDSGPSCSLKHTSRSLESLEKALGNKEARRKTDLVDLVRTTLQAYRNMMESSGTILSMDQELLVCILAVWTAHPSFGYRRISHYVRQVLAAGTVKRIRKIMHASGLQAVFPGPNTSRANKKNRKYPYLLRNKRIWLPNQVWSTDVTYLKLPVGAMYLVAIIDMYTRKVLSWRLSNTLDASFCVECLQEALDAYGEPAIFHSDHGCQFTSNEFTDILENHGIDISMTGVGRCLQNIFIERFWRTVKYEEFYLHEYKNVAELRDGIKRFMDFYNTSRVHQSLGYQTPDDLYYSVFVEGKSKENVA